MLSCPVEPPLSAPRVILEGEHIGEESRLAWDFQKLDERITVVIPPISLKMPGTWILRSR